MANGRFDRITNPDGTGSCPVALEDNAVLLSGYVSDVGSIFQGKLFARVYDSDMLQVLNLDTPNGQYGFVREYFPVDGQIYVSPSAEDTYVDEEIINEKFYSSYYDVPLVINGADIDNDFATGDDVWLVVSFGLDYKTWTPTGIVGTSTIQFNVNSGSGLIRLGCCKGDFGIVGDQNQNKFALEDNKPIYYYDGVTMTELRIWLAQNSGAVFTPFFTVGASDSRISFTPNSSTYALLHIDETIPVGRYLMTGTVVIVNTVKIIVHAHVVLRIGPTNNWTQIAAVDVTIPAAPSGTEYSSVAVNLCGSFVNASSTLTWGMLIEVETPSGVVTEYAYVPRFCPETGWYSGGATSQGARLFLQKVASS